MPNIYTDPSIGKSTEQVEQESLIHSDGFAPGFAG